MNHISTTNTKIISLLEFLMAAGIILFWTAFFAQGIVSFADSRLKDVYLAFESSFPVADAVLALFLIIGGIGLLRNTPSGKFFTVMAGAMLIFLGLLDISFNIRQGIYLLGPGEAVLNIGINAACLAGGAFFAWSAWKSEHRQAAAAGRISSPELKTASPGFPGHV
jgi:hypothetical protein